ncbi:GLEYA domain-containing protein [Microdochium nivale]|nr:GLEYA domain-containing protein [Microdochium nivale]
MRAFTLLAAVLPVGISALPAPAALNERQLINNILCLPYNIIINSLLVDPALIPFCGQYGPVPTTTITRAPGATVTVTSLATVTGPGAVTVINTSTITAPAAPPPSITSTITSTLTTYSGTTQATCLASAYVNPVKGKRAVDASVGQHGEDGLTRRLLGGLLSPLLGGSAPASTSSSMRVPISVTTSAVASAVSSLVAPIATPTAAIPAIASVASSAVSVVASVVASIIAPVVSTVPGGVVVSVPRPSYLPVSLPDVSVSLICSCAAPTAKVTVGVPGAPTVTATSTTTINPAATVSTAKVITYTPPSGNALTVTTTITSTVAAMATSIAPNGKGLPYRKYTSDFNAYLQDSGFSANYFKGKTPDFTGTYNALNFATPFWPSMDVDFTLQLDQPAPWDASQVATLFQGFFVAPQSGTYTFTVPASNNDNFAELWVGPSAFAWTDQTAAFKVIRGASGSTPDGVLSVTMNAGDAQPFSYLWANGGGAARSAFSILLPDGTQPTDISNLFVQACNAGVFQ